MSKPSALAYDAAITMFKTVLKIRSKAITKNAREEAQLNALLKKLHTQYEELSALSDTFDTQDAQAGL